MKQVNKSVLLWYSPREMFDLVTDIPHYPQFLPWCDRAEVLQQHQDGVTARLGLAFAGLKHAFTTRNHHEDAHAVRMELVDGPFSVLDGIWHFIPIGDPQEQVAPDGSKVLRQACKVTLDLRYAFAGRALDAVLGPVFDRVANTLIDAFVSRAEAVYGPR